MGVDVSTETAGDSAGFREAASGEAFPDLLLCVLSRFGLFVDEIDRNGSLELGKNHVHLLYMGFSKFGRVVPKKARRKCRSGDQQVHFPLLLLVGILLWSIFRQDDSCEQFC